MSDGRCPCCGAAEWCPAENAKADARERDPHPECTLERVRELEAAIAAVREAVEKATAHERRILDACERGDPNADPSAILYACSLGFRAVRDILAAPAPPPAAEPVTEQERVPPTVDDYLVETDPIGTAIDSVHVALSMETTATNRSRISRALRLLQAAKAEESARRAVAREGKP